MSKWRSQSVECFGSVQFPGTIPPRLDNFLDQLQAEGVSARPLPCGPDAHWQAELEHPDWGKARATCPRDWPSLPRELVMFDGRLTESDRDAASRGGRAVTVRMAGAKENVLRDRKLLLRFLGCLMGHDGTVVFDHLAWKPWTREALDEELAHDADLDIDSLFVVHLVQGEAPAREGERPAVDWAHTHGLAELGAFDFDILRPSQLLLEAAADGFRAIAYLLLDEEVGPRTESFDVVLPNGAVSFVPVEEWSRAAPEEERRLRDADDPGHNTRRLVLCDPRRPAGGLRRLLGSGRQVRASRLLSTIDDEGMMWCFTSSATDLMAERARRTIQVFRRFGEEFADLEVVPLVKLAYRMDGADETQREHLWFEVHGHGEGTVEATLLNEPYYIRGMKAGERATHDLGRLTDWTIATPAGCITPRQMVVSRVLRAHRDELLEALAEEKAERRGR